MYLRVIAPHGATYTSVFRVVQVRGDLVSIATLGGVGTGTHDVSMQWLGEALERGHVVVERLL
jgi:hypothetical protein